MRYLTALLLLVTLYSCNTRKLIHYTYNNVTITRIDSNASSYFYYGDCDGNNCKDSSYVAVSYHADSNMMRVYLVFKDSSKVELVEGSSGSVKPVGLPDEMLIASRYADDTLAKVLDGYKALNYPVILLSNIIPDEISGLQKTPNQPVKVKYE